MIRSASTSSLYIHRNALERIARNILLNYRVNYLNTQPQALPVEEMIRDVFGLSIMDAPLYGKTKGMVITGAGTATCYDAASNRIIPIAVRERTILIDSSLTAVGADQKEYRYVCAHLLAHWVLHKELLGTGGKLDPNQLGSSRDASMIEWQADYLAQAMLMPTGPVKRCYNELRFGSGSGMTEEQTVSDISEIFGVPRTHVDKRLKKLGLTDS